MGQTLNVEVFFSIRDAASDTITNLGNMSDKIVMVNSDLAGSSRTNGFTERWPERSFNVGIAEGNMVSFAAGLAHEGFMPFVFTMAPFLSMRACEQVRTDVAYGGLNVRMISSYAGYASGDCGATHCGLEDVAIFSTMGGMTVLEPSDPNQVCKMYEAMVDYEGPIYMRSGNAPMRPIYADDQPYEIGKALVPVEGDDGAFIVSGPVVQYAIDAAARLREECGVNVRVVDMHTIKPIDVDAILSAAKTGRIVAAQDHNIIGGLGYMVAGVLAEAGVAPKFKMLGCPDEFVPVATMPYLYHKNGYDTDGLFENMKALLN